MQDKHKVTVIVEKSDGFHEILHAKYVIGCDGAHSVVRNPAKAITFGGDLSSQRFILCDDTIDSSESKTDLRIQQIHVCIGNGRLVSFPLEDVKRRLFASRYGANPGQEDLSLREFEKLLAQFLPDGGKMTISDPTWLNNFSVHHRIADKYRDGRLLVAGDAAHIHSPAGGQGGNTSIQDAVNLGWKLAAVLRGEKPVSFLDTYHEERHPIGVTLLSNSDQRLRFVCSRNPVFLFFRNLLVPYLLPPMDKVSPQRLARFDSQLWLIYRKSSINGTAPGYTSRVRGGDRVIDAKIRNKDGKVHWFQELLTAGSHHLVLFSSLKGADNTEKLQQVGNQFSKQVSLKTKVHIIYKE